MNEQVPKGWSDPVIDRAAKVASIRSNLSPREKAREVMRLGLLELFWEGSTILVRSLSSPDAVWHTCRLVSGGKWGGWGRVCSCWGFQGHGHCWHLEAIDLSERAHNHDLEIDPAYELGIA